MVYYNEFDPFAAAWLRELIAAGHIAFGVVDERSIEDVTPAELMQFKQCHFFAGVGVWSYALRRAGWPDDRRVWTGSCPCQPFSAAGKGDGFADERHLWPAFNHLIGQCKPDIVFGEQVASKDADTWIDLVHTDMEALGYAFGAIPFPSASVGAPHIRDRLYWVADSELPKRGQSDQRGTVDDGQARGRNEGADRIGERGAISRMGNTILTGLEGQSRHGNRSDEPGRIGAEQSGSTAEVGTVGGLGDSSGDRPEMWGNIHGEMPRQGLVEGRITRVERPSPTNGFWRDADWLGCRDGKWRPVESGTFPLAHGAAARVGRLRGYGNAINAQQAQIFIEAYLAC